ncbi:MAG: N-formylglutamate amidohydrolase [Desulfobacteraceae bacterium]|nr:N-formylglutamate amidohydrolase [Desulfobacteraceae bacterium]
MIIITCEHGGNKIPKPYQRLFKGHEELLNSHRGYDLGAVQTARMMAERFNAPLFAAFTSRLLVDLNRSVGHPRLFSKITRSWTPAVKKSILDRYYFPHRDPIQRAVTKAMARKKRVLHIACHSFTPVLDGQVRDMDVGLLYDPRREAEKEFCRQWKAAIRESHPIYKISSNEPYKGVSDGLATYFRTLYPERYIGIELELNQRTFVQGWRHWRDLSEAVLDGLETAIRSKV